MPFVIGGCQQRARERERDRALFSLRDREGRSTKSEGKRDHAILCPRDRMFSTESERERGRAFVALVTGGYPIESEGERDQAFFALRDRRVSTESERERDQALFPS